MNIAQKVMNQNEQDNMTLESKNLDNMAYQKDQNHEEESTAWIFQDGSALISTPGNNWEVKADYGLHCDHEQLGTTFDGVF